MGKRSFSVFALWLVMAWPLATASGQDRVLRVVGASGMPGQSVTLGIELQATGNENAAGFSLAWDPQVLDNPVVVAGTGVVGASINVNANQAAGGRLGIVLALPANQVLSAGRRELVRVTFNIASNASQAALITLGDQPVTREVADAVASALVTTYANGQVSLVTPPTVATIPAAPNSTEEVRVAASGIWPDGCVPAAPVVTRVGTVVTIATTPGGTVCTQALTPYALDIPIGKLPRGVFTIELIHRNPLGSLRLATLPLTVIGGMISANAGSYNLESVAADSIVALFGADLATGSSAATTVPLPTSLAGTTLVVRDAAGVDRPAPLFYVSPLQVNYQVPPGTAPGRALLTLTNGAGGTSVGSITVAGIAPGLFTLDGSGRGLVAAYVLRVTGSGTVTYEQVWRLDAAGALVPQPIDLGPATDQVFLVMFGTGFRRRSSQGAVSVTTGGVSAEVLYAGEAPDFVGLDQCNLRLDRQLIGRGTVEIEMIVDRLPASRVTMTVK